MTMKVEKCEIGQSLDDFLKEQGLFELISFQALANVIIELNLEHPEQSQNFLEAIEMITTPQYTDQQETKFIDNIVHFVDSPISEMKHID